MAAPTIDWERLVRERCHWVQVAALDLLAMDGGRVMSPNEIAFELQVPLGNCSYHVTQLAEDAFLELVATEPRRGAVEHYYRLSEVPDAS